MARMRPTRFAWRLLTHDPQRLALSVLGVAFAVFLMFTEMGFLFGVYDSQCLLVSRFRSDLVLMNRGKEDVSPSRPFPRARLVAMLAAPEVESVCPVYFREGGGWNATGGKGGAVVPIPTLAFDPDEAALEVEGLGDVARRLAEPGTVLADSRSRKYYQGLKTGQKAELNGHHVRVAGRFELGPDFRLDGRLLTSTETLARAFPGTGPHGLDLDQVEFGLVRLRPGSDPDAVAHRLRKTLPADVRLLTREELVAKVRLYWATNQPIGMVFGLGMVMGFIIGVVVCYQILFSEVNDKQREFATLKAIGMDDRYLFAVVNREALVLALLAFLPGLACHLLMARTLQDATGIVMRLSPARGLGVFVMTVLMCLIAARVAVGKVTRSDPAEVF